MQFWRITAAGVLGLGSVLAIGSVSAQSYGPEQPPAGQPYLDQPSVNQQSVNQQPSDQGRPGTVNYVEGAVSLDHNPLTNKSVGRVVMDAGQVLSTGEGKAEVLLNPGIYLRVDDNSAVKMISTSLTPNVVEVVSGRAGVEVDQLLKGNVVQIVNHGVTTQLAKTGYYEFDADNGSLRVFSGRAQVEVANDKWQKVTGGRQLMLDEGPGAKANKFHANPQEDTLMNWSKLRSQYLAQANNQLAAQYYGPGFYPGWYWSPGMWGYTYLGYGPFYSPFGWGYYPFGWGGWYGGGGVWYGHAFHGHVMGR